MKAKDYRDLLLKKYARDIAIPQEAVEKLVYKFLCEIGLWTTVVDEVKRTTDIDMPKEILTRMSSNAQICMDVLLRVDCTFDWTSASYPSGDRERKITFWHGIFKKWCDFTTLQLARTKVIHNRI